MEIYLIVWWFLVSIFFVSFFMVFWLLKLIVRCVFVWLRVYVNMDGIFCFFRNL